ncbi:hypothetical protein AB0H36_27835 [Kribbella sp. NPDC050820]|uniref:hypothetical protein n=1 Tax=Kribbella sp. NPDC050820 TaxID=3155408 RepID=UPI0033D0016A
MTAGGWVGVGLFLFLLIFAGTIAYIAVSTVLPNRTKAQREAGLKVLAEFRQMLRDLFGRR